MASGLVVVSSGVGGRRRTDRRWPHWPAFPGRRQQSSGELPDKRLTCDSTLLNELRQTGQQEARQRFSVMAAALEAGFRLNAHKHSAATVF